MSPCCSEGERESCSLSNFCQTLSHHLRPPPVAVRIMAEITLYSVEMLDACTKTNHCSLQHLSIGSDIARSLLVFAKGKPLGPKGLDWLKIHLINLTGFKKRYV